MITFLVFTCVNKNSIISKLCGIKCNLKLYMKYIFDLFHSPFNWRVCVRFQLLFGKLINKLESCLSESELGSAWSSINSSKFLGEYLEA